MSGAFKSGVMGGLMGFIISALSNWVAKESESKAQTQTLCRLVSIFEKLQALLN
jgi:hypothetical protein